MLLGELYSHPERRTGDFLSSTGRRLPSGAWLAVADTNKSTESGRSPSRGSEAACPDEGVRASGWQKDARLGKPPSHGKRVVQRSAAADSHDETASGKRRRPLLLPEAHRRAGERGQCGPTEAQAASGRRARDDIIMLSPDGRSCSTSRRDHTPEHSKVRES